MIFPIIGAMLGVEALRARSRRRAEERAMAARFVSRGPAPNAPPDYTELNKTLAAIAAERVREAAERAARPSPLSYYAPPGVKL